MKRWIKRALFGIFGASILVGGLSACGHHPHEFGAGASAEQHAKFRSWALDRATRMLDLNADQQQRLAVLADKLQAQRTALMGAAPDPRAQIKALVATDKFDRAGAQTLITEKTTTLQTRSPELIAALADFYDSLNPTQQQKVRELMEHRRGWFHRG
jgi:periplasmic protein CpxP/Spy